MNMSRGFNGFIGRGKLAITRPDLLWRKVRGLQVIDISLDEIAPHIAPSPTILEAGALNGNDTLRMAKMWPTATIHAFEPVPRAFEEVKQRTNDLRRVHCYELALSDRTGTASMYVSNGSAGEWRPASSSLLTPRDHLSALPEVRFQETISVQTVTLDDWAFGEGVDGIDFMWLDIQGMELPVLKASPITLGTCSAVHMEVARTELYANCGTYDEILPWMAEQGFDCVIDRVTLHFGNALFVRMSS
jgi:2-O-methyltransferase